MDFRIIKLGGKVIDQPEMLDDFLKNFATLCKARPDLGFVLVHGGGVLATKACERLGIPVKMIDGRRVTDEQTMQVVQAVYAGLVNKSVVAKLAAQGCKSIGLSGADGDLIRAHRRAPVNGIDYGLVGEIDKVNPEILIEFIKLGMIPVLAPLSHDGQGQILNTNADTIAQEVAKSLSLFGKVELVFAFENKGVLINTADPDRSYPLINEAVFEQGKRDGSLAGGILPKLENALAAVKNGINRVRICHWQDIAKLANDQTEFGTIVVLK